MKRGREISEKPDIQYEKEPTKARPYLFGETYDPEDKTRDYSLCPTCGRRRTGAPHVDTEAGKMTLVCREGHEWVLDMKTKTIRRESRPIKFGEDELFHN